MTEWFNDYYLLIAQLFGGVGLATIAIVLVVELISSGYFTRRRP